MDRDNDPTFVHRSGDLIGLRQGQQNPRDVRTVVVTRRNQISPITSEGVTS